MQLLLFLITTYLAVGTLTLLIVDLVVKYGKNSSYFSRSEKLIIVLIWPSIYYKLLTSNQSPKN